MFTFCNAWVLVYTWIEIGEINNGTLCHTRTFRTIWLFRFLLFQRNDMTTTITGYERMNRVGTVPLYGHKESYREMCMCVCVHMLWTKHATISIHVEFKSLSKNMKCGETLIKMGNSQNESNICTGWTYIWIFRIIFDL